MPASKKKKPGRPRSKSAPPAILSSPKKRKRKQWTNEAMLSALEAVKTGEPILRAARIYGVPRATLQDRIHGRVTHGTNPGPKPYLSRLEEKELSNFVVDVAKAGYGETRKEIISIAENVASEKGRLQEGKRFGKGWYRQFMERQPDLSLRKGDATANVRMDCLNSETMKRYFDLLKEVLEENELLDSPAQIYNVDETGMPLDHRPPKIIAKRGQKKVRYRTSGNKSQITVIGCVSAAGQAIPPFVIFAAKSLNFDWTVGEVPGTTYGLSDKGWVDTTLFQGWLINHFLKNAVSSRPLFLLLDGHSSHYQPALLKFAKDQEIILFCLPPHTTHESQPLDTSVFKPLKQHWQEVCHEYMQKNPGKLVTKYQFSTLLNQAWMKTMSPSTICSGFRTCGVYPFNPDAIDCGIDLGESSPAQDGNSSHSNSDDGGDDSDEECDDFGHESANEQFSPKTLELYSQRYEEGYNIYQPDYVRWLKIFHPSDVPQDEENNLSSILENFASITPLSETHQLASFVVCLVFAIILSLVVSYLDARNVAMGIK